MCICMAESLCYPPETITTMLTGYNPIQNKKLKKNKTIRALFLHAILLDPPDEWASLIAHLKRIHLQCRRPQLGFLGWEDPLEKGKATHSSILAWRIPQTV